ncbi:hypothetical protein EDB87DRAFT_1753055 [Lactarius vividus]|nr:hypothetical protein EDB87DRAFT_1753055 [Lactarius vividus]
MLDPPLTSIPSVITDKLDERPLGPPFEVSCLYVISGSSRTAHSPCGPRAFPPSLSSIRAGVSLRTLNAASRIAKESIGEDEGIVGDDGVSYNMVDWGDTVPGLTPKASILDDNPAGNGLRCRVRDGASRRWWYRDMPSGSPSTFPSPVALQVSL